MENNNIREQIPIADRIFTFQEANIKNPKTRVKILK